MKKISTSALAKQLKIEWKELFELLIENNYIEIKRKWLFNSDEIKVLTQKWEEAWWELKVATKFWDYIVWPENFQPIKKDINTWYWEYVTISNISEQFWISARKMNQIISELWWIEKNIKWWKLTKFWESLWWKELIINRSWATYTKWPENIKTNNSLLLSLWLENKISKNDNNSNLENKKDSPISFREKFPAQYRTKDGHMVRSRWELVIDNSLYEYWLVHAYERKLPIEEDVYSDFYIPSQNWSKAVYIEYWGIEDQEKYQERKKIKQDIYKKHHLNLIELENKHIDNLDDYLPRMLLEYWINVD